jgi:glycosyltransferase involved in cell wall biosynthesis
MLTLLFFLAVVVFLFNLYAVADIVLGIQKMRDLADIRPFSGRSPPMVSIIVPACNEEDTIEPALLSLLNLEYPALEILVINDRSTDRTGEVLARIQQKYQQLKIHEIQKLPEGWMGKNHALYQGARLANGEFLLFTDADIIFDKTTLSRAISLMVSEHLDHLALIFRNIARGLLLNAMMVDAGGGLFFLFKPWKVNDPHSRYFIGVGAFNLVRKSVYMEIKGHESIRMHPIDDIMLGKIIKQNGFRQECLSGYDFLTVHWYDSPQKMINGLMKNIFALYDFRVTYAAAAVLMIILTTILPFWGMFPTHGLTRIFCILSVAIRLFSSACGVRHTNTTIGMVPLSLLTPYINIYIIVKGVLKTLSSGGIEWRGTRYPLARLRKNPPILCRNFRE